MYGQTVSPEETKKIARNQQEATLKQMSLLALHNLAFESYGMRVGSEVPKAELIQRILDQAYGKESQ